MTAFRPLLRILALWRGRAAWLLAGLVVALLSLGAGVGLMVLSGHLVAAAIAGTALVAGAALRLLGIARVVLRYVERLVTHAATFRALADLRVWFFRGLARKSAGGLGFARAGDVLARLASDVEALDGLYLRILVPLAGALLLLPVLILAAAPESGSFAAVIAALFLLAGFLLPGFAARAARHEGGRLAATHAALRVQALDALTGLREVRAFGAEGRMLAAVQAREAVLLGVQRGLAHQVAAANAGAFLCGQAALVAALIAAGAHPVAAVLLVFLTIAAFEAVAGLPRAGALAGAAAAAAARVLEAAEGPGPIAEPAHPAPLPVSTALRFEAVSFRWDATRPPVFDGLSLDIPQGARIALLGPSGAGKSTLAALALKVAAPNSGRVVLGGTDIATLAAGAIRSRIAWLSQATHLFDDTIRANLLLGRPEADGAGPDQARLWAALDDAAIGDLVRSLPDQLDSWVGEGGTRFSGGQARRLALARALLSDAPILILDEPAAGLDADTERAFLTTLNDVAPGRSVLLIAHRLTGAERLDRIYRISNGHAVAAAA